MFRASRDVLAEAIKESILGEIELASIENKMVLSNLKEMVWIWNFTINGGAS